MTFHAPLVFDYVYTSVDSEAEPFAEPELIPRGVSTGILNSDVNPRFHVQQSRRSFRRCQDQSHVQRALYPSGSTGTRFSTARRTRRPSSGSRQHPSAGGPERATVGCSSAQRHLRNLQAGSHHGLRITARGNVPIKPLAFSLRHPRQTFPTPQSEQDYVAQPSVGPPEGKGSAVLRWENAGE